MMGTFKPMSREFTKKIISGPPSILFNLRRLWYASSMVETLCDDKDVVLVVDDEEMIGEMIGTHGGTPWMPALYLLTIPQRRYSTI